MMKLVTVFLTLSAVYGFAPSSQPRASTELKNFLDGISQDPSTNAYSRGGKNSWEFEQETMYVGETKTNPWSVLKGAVPKKAVTKAAAPAPKKAGAAKAPKFVNPFAKKN